MTKAAAQEWANLKPGTLIEWTVTGVTYRGRTIGPMWRNGRRYSYALRADEGYSVPAHKVRPVLPVAD